MSIVATVASWAASLGESGAAKVLGGLAVLIAGALGGWWTSRASIMTAVDKRVNSMMDHYEREIARLTTAHHECEDRVTKLGARIDQLAGLLRQEKQTADSIKRLGEI